MLHISLRMKSILFIQAVIAIFSISSECCLAQNDDRVEQVVYMIGNTCHQRDE